MTFTHCGLECSECSEIVESEEVVVHSALCMFILCNQCKAEMRGDHLVAETGPMFDTGVIHSGNFVPGVFHVRTVRCL
jgi:hypothetical protein